mgnify:CR=1 FL=1
MTQRPKIKITVSFTLSFTDRWNAREAIRYVKQSLREWAVITEIGKLKNLSVKTVKEA